MGPTDNIFQALSSQILALQRKQLAYDQNISRMQQDINRPTRPIYIPITQFSGYLSNQFLGSGAPNLEQINSLAVVGAKIDAVGDSCHHLFFVPKDFNVNTNIKFEVVWCTDSVDTAETATWDIKYLSVASGETLAAATTPLSQVITADNVLGAYKIAVAPYGVMSKEELYHGDLLHLNVSLSAVSGLNPAVDKVYLLGILINDQG